MKGAEVLEEIEKAEDNVRQADKLAAYFKEHPEIEENVAEAAGLSVTVSGLINSMNCCQERRLMALKQALREADINV